MDALRVGRSLRALRLRRHLRQADVATRAGISRAQYGRIERGEIRGISVASLHAAVDALGASLELRVRWHGEGLDRLLDEAHSRLANAVVEGLERRGWTTAVEVTFNHFGERGSIDVLAWRAVAATLLVIEVKSVVPDAQAMISTLDRKARLAREIGRGRGWKATVVGRLLVIADYRPRGGGSSRSTTCSAPPFRSAASRCAGGSHRRKGRSRGCSFSQMPTGMARDEHQLVAALLGCRRGRRLGPKCSPAEQMGL